MPDPVDLLLRHGELALFAAILIEGIGVPLPAVPFMLAAGAMAGAGKLGPATLLSLGVAAGVLGDGLWYWLGRSKGGVILKILCRVSLEPDSCVGTAKGVFERHGSRGLVVAKFVPVLGGVIPPLAGIFGVGAVKFLFFDAVGSLLYVGVYGSLGFFFSKQLGVLADTFPGLGAPSFFVIVASFAGYLAWKWFRRRAFLNKLKMARITAEELKKMQDAGQAPLIFDIRSALDLQAVPYVVPGARWIAKEDFKKRHGEIPRDREVVLYCSCPNEASAAQVAQLLQKHGIRRVRPLLGGIEAWMQRGFATEAAPN